MSDMRTFFLIVVVSSSCASGNNNDMRPPSGEEGFGRALCKLEGLGHDRTLVVDDQLHVRCTATIIDGPPPVSITCVGDPWACSASRLGPVRLPEPVISPRSFCGRLQLKCVDKRSTWLCKQCGLKCATRQNETEPWPDHVVQASGVARSCQIEKQSQEKVDE